MMEEETFDSKIDPCGVCGTTVMSNSVLHTACGKWVHTRCTDKKKAAPPLTFCQEGQGGQYCPLHFSMIVTKQTLANLKVRLPMQNKFDCL